MRRPSRVEIQRIIREKISSDFKDKIENIQFLEIKWGIGDICSVMVMFDKKDSTGKFLGHQIRRYEVDESGTVVGGPFLGDGRINKDL